MANKVAAAALQYSKKLSKTITWFWIIYRFAFLIEAAIFPSVAEVVASTIYNVDLIMIINVGTYLVNSLGEKYIYSDRYVLTWLKGGGWKDTVNAIKSIGSSIKEVESETEVNG